MDNAPVGAQRAAPSLLRDRLERYYRENTDPEVQISDFTPISDGWETEVYSFTITLRHEIRYLILRVYPGATEAAAAKMLREYQGMLGLGRVGGYPVPLVMHHDTDPSWLGKPFLIMQKIDGRPLGNVMRADTARQSELLIRFILLLVDLHQINYRPYVDPYNEYDGSTWLHDILTRWRSLVVDNYKQGWATPVFNWLEAGILKVRSANTWSPLHGDFHPNNILLTPENKLYVIDWSGFAVGDYRFDLAWTLLLISTQGYPELRALILSEYERLSHHPVENIEYFDVIACLRRLFDLSASLGSGAESLGMRAETVEIMRRQRDHYQQVYAVLQKITGLTLPDIERLIDSLQA